MKKSAAPAIVLALILSDAFLKSYVTSSSFSHARFYHFFMYSMLALFLASAILLFQYFKKTDAGEELWERCTSQREAFPYEGLIVVCILLLGFFLRFWNLSGLFSGIYHDEAYSGLDGIAIRHLGERPVFLNWNAGGEALVAYLVAISTVFFHYSVFAVRAVEALAGSLTLFFFYRLLKEIFNSRIAIISLLLLAFSKHHLIYSRFGIWLNLVPLFEVAVLYYVRRGLIATRHANVYFVVAGLLAGLGFYSYIAYRIFPFVLIAFLLDSGNRKLAGARVRSLILAVALCCIVVAPVAIYSLKHPASVTNRMQMVALWQIKGVPLYRLLVTNARWTFGMFTFIGDSNPRHNVLSEPMLSPFLTGFFWIGILLSLANIRKAFAFFNLAYFGLGLVPGILSIQSPHAGRALASLPPALILSSMGLLGAVQIVSRWNMKMVWPLLAFSFAGVLITGPNDALFRYSKYLDSYEPLTGMDRLEENVVQLVKSHGSRCQYYLSPQLFFHASVEYLSYPHPVQKLYVRETRFDPNTIAIVLFVKEPRYLWWVTDDDRKNYFKWWHQVYGWPVEEIRNWCSEFYSPPPGYRRSDSQILAFLKKEHPAGREISFDHFSAFVFKP